MSFEMKYDKNGVPLKNNIEPVAPIEVVAEVMAENQTESEPELVETPTEVAQEVEAAPVEKPVDKTINWKKLREEREQSERKIKELEEALAAKSAGPEEDLSLNLGEDDFAEGKHLNKLVKKNDMRFQQMEQQLKQYEQQAQIARQKEVENQFKENMRAKYTDWDSIYSDENLARLEIEEPEIYVALNSSPDVAKARISAYKMIKKMGISAPVDTYSQDKVRAQTNAAKPKPLASISPQQGDSPLSKANAFANGNMTDDLKKSLWKEVNDARKGY